MTSGAGRRHADSGSRSPTQEHNMVLIGIDTLVKYPIKMSL